MIWQDYARQLKEVLQLDGSPVAVTFSNTSADNSKETMTMSHTAFYQAARKAGDSEYDTNTPPCAIWREFIMNVAKTTE